MREDISYVRNGSTVEKRGLKYRRERKHFSKCSKDGAGVERWHFVNRCQDLQHFCPFTDSVLISHLSWSSMCQKLGFHRVKDIKGSDFMRSKSV